MNKKIVIIGAGPSGIAAATKLKSNGFENIKLLEAENRIGGRINTIQFGQNVVDMGAEWCYGEKGNVVHEMAKDKNLLEALPETDRKFSFTKSNGEQIPEDVDRKLSSIYYEIYEGFDNEKKNYDGSYGNFFAEKYKQIVADEKYKDISSELIDQVFECFHKIENTSDATDNWYETSCRSAMEFWDCEGADALNWKGKGFSTVLDLLQNKVPNAPAAQAVDVLPYILLNKEVQKIVYNNAVGSPIRVECADGTVYNADHLICTIPLGVLKKQHLNMFEPMLPYEKIRTIDGLQFGTVDKIFVEFEAPFWSKEWEGMSFLWQPEELKVVRNDPVNGDWLEGLVGFYCVDYQPNVICGWVTGPFARKMEQKTDEQIKAGVMKVIRMFRKSLNVPEPKAVICSKWNSNPHFCGSVSNISLESDALGATTTKLAAPINDKNGKPLVQFAGEATDQHYYSTVHGAIGAGWREAQRLIDLYRVAEVKA